MQPGWRYDQVQDQVSPGKMGDVVPLLPRNRSPKPVTETRVTILDREPALGLVVRLWSYEDYLRELLDIEISSREDRTAVRRLHEPHFPDVKTLDQIDWQA